MTAAIPLNEKMLGETGVLKHGAGISAHRSGQPLLKVMMIVQIKRGLGAGDSPKVGYHLSILFTDILH